MDPKYLRKGLLQWRQRTIHAIAIPQFAAYRKRGYEAQVKSDLRNAAMSEEAYFAQNTTYKFKRSFFLTCLNRISPQFWLVLRLTKPAEVLYISLPFLTSTRIL